MPRNAHAQDTLTLEEMSWLRTLNVDVSAIDLATTPIATLPPSPSSPQWVTAPNSPTWSSPPISPKPPVLSKTAKKEARRIRNRYFAKVARERKEAYTKAMQAKVEEIERVNQALRAQVERELERNAALKESLGMEEGE